MIVTKMIDRVKFSLFSPEMIRKISSTKITVPDTYNDDSYPIDGGLVDPKMGVIDPGLKCKTCGGKLRSCPGHFAHIELVRPVIHPEFGKYILLILKSTCHSCKRLLHYSEAEIEELAAKIDSDSEEDAKNKAKKKQPHCPHCKAKAPEIKLLRPTTFTKDGQMMLPTEVRDWLSVIPDRDLRILGLDPHYARPEWMVITALLVPPVSVRTNKRSRTQARRISRDKNCGYQKRTEANNENHSLWMCGGLDCAGWKPASTRRSSRSSRCVLAGRRAFTDTVGHAVTDSEPGHHAATHPQPDFLDEQNARSAEQRRNI
jgi:DNA-directed RNA polymerase beta' subunit